jgi:tRNA(fMet)-specific endonuclease VapC
MRLLLDTNAYSGMMRGDPGVASLIRMAEHVYLPHPVIGELLFGFRLGRREDENLQILREFLAAPVVSVMGIDYETCEVYARIGEQLRSAGTPVPTNDHWIAAIAIRHHLTLLTRDAHFSRVPGLDFRKG